MIKELILDANEIIEKECNIQFEKFNDNACDTCKYNKSMKNKYSFCVMVEELADKYKNT